MVKIYCNRCNKELDRNNKIGYIALYYRRQCLGDFTGDNQYEDMDFCTECMDAFKTFLTGVQTEESVAKQPKLLPDPWEEADAQPETESELQKSEADQHKELFRAPKDGTTKPEGKKTRQKIDYGKIMALHNAGWDYKKIADEMGMTNGSVATAISTYKKKMRVGGARRRWKLKM